MIPATTTFAAGDAVQLEDSMSSPAIAGTTFTITLTTTVLPASVTANNSTKLYIISGGGKISGSTALTKSGSNKLTISTANDYSGGTTLSAGTLVINNSAALGSGTFTITGGTVDATQVMGLSTYNNAQAWNGDFSFLGTADLNLGSGAVALDATRAVTVTASTLTVGGVISGSGYGLTKAGVGTLTLSGASTYTGATTVSEGTLVVDGSTASGSAVTVDATLAGIGTAAGIVAVNGIIAPGDFTVGTLNTGAETWNGGGSYEVEISDATGTAGEDPGWDLLNITGTLDVAATSGSKFIIRLGSVATVHFDNTQNYTWRIATASGGVTGFDASKFTVDDSSFSEVKGTGHFNVKQSGNDVYLQFVHITASPVTIGRAWGTYLRILKSEFVASNTSGGTGNRSLQSVTSRDGDYVDISTDYILFAPAGNANRVLDYTVVDSSTPTPFTDSSTITVNVTNAVSAVNNISSTGNGITITFAGIPGYKYVVERSYSASDWTGATTVQTVEVDSSGVWTYTEASPHNPSFYRLRQNNTLE